LIGGDGPLIDLPGRWQPLLLLESAEAGNAEDALSPGANISWRIRALTGFSAQLGPAKEKQA
jgi:hypothetical protein